LHLLINVFAKNLVNSKEILEILAINGADLNIKNNELWSAIHLAVKRGSYDAAEALLKLNENEMI